MAQNEQEINALLILEVLGRPPEHIVSALTALIEQMGKEKGIKILSKEVKKPKLLESDSIQDKNQNLYATFAEVEIQVNSLFDLVGIMFKYMPSHVEILSPENISAKNADWNDILNDLTRRLHTYDEVVRTMQMEKAVLENKLKSLLVQEKQIPVEMQKTREDKQLAKTKETKISHKNKKPKKKA